MTVQRITWPWIVFAVLLVYTYPSYASEQQLHCKLTDSSGFQRMGEIFIDYDGKTIKQSGLSYWENDRFRITSIKEGEISFNQEMCSPQSGICIYRTYQLDMMAPYPAMSTFTGNLMTQAGRVNTGHARLTLKRCSKVNLSGPDSMLGIGSKRGQ